MPKNCSICLSLVSRSNPGVECNGACKKTFHPKCVNLPVGLIDFLDSPGLKWMCEICSKKEMQVMMVTLEKCQQKQDDMLRSVEFCSASIDDFARKISDFSAALKKIEVLEAKVAKVEADNTSLRVEMANLNQYMRRNNIEISGVPETKGENVIEIVQNIGETVGVNISPTVIDTCHRVPNHSGGLKPKSIIVKFSSRLAKQNLLSAAKMKRQALNTSSLGLKNMNAKPFYLTDHLTPQNKMLLFKVKSYCRENGFKYVWVNDCKILVRKSDTDRIHHITDEASLAKLR